MPIELFNKNHIGYVNIKKRFINILVSTTKHSRKIIRQIKKKKNIGDTKKLKQTKKKLI